MPLDTIFQQVAALLAICAVVGVLATLLRQPLIVGFIAAGIIVGPTVLGIVEESPEIDLLATIGIALLLFVVGLKLDLRLVRVVGPVALATGLGQVLFTSIVGFAIALALGMSAVTALYVAVALTFSSTVIIVKLLSDKDEIDELHGRIAIGFLIVQDIVVVLVMIGLSGFAGDTDVGLARQALDVALRGVAFVGGILALAKWVLPRLLRYLAGSAELLVLFAIAWAVLLASVGDLLGFSEEVGAFLAGVSLASTPYRDALGARLMTLRDFLLLFFFITLGIHLDFSQAGDQLAAAVVLSLFVLVGNPIIVMVIMGAMGYRARVSFRAGLTVAQISEFSLILVSLGFALGHIGGETVGLVTAVGIITITLSTYLISNSAWLYERFASLLRVFERRHAHDVRLDADGDGPLPDVVVLGLGRYGSHLVAALRRAGSRPLGVDFDPRALRHWEQRGLQVVYGDAQDPEIVSVLPLHVAEWVISSVRDFDTNLALVQALEQRGYRGRVAVTALSEDDAGALERAGAHAVLRPFAAAASEAVTALLRARRPEDRPPRHPAT
ncbi:MAG TPA: cation:proton antiporter family protein [Egibacteraceae bacterium]|jgi:Kef-type K+ transport system membrane component KefB|nr:cation:proton antiporter family protein [Egibacteraceae bacterium]